MGASYLPRRQNIGYNVPRRTALLSGPTSIPQLQRRAPKGLGGQRVPHALSQFQIETAGLDMLDHGTLDTGHVTPEEDLRHRLRHSAAHVMADAVLKLFPEAKIAIGPPTQDGFYYDFDVSRPFTPEDLEEIEGLMVQAIAAGQPFHREEVELEEARAMFADQPYKLEIIDGLADAETLSIYRQGEFVDLCQGPHVENTAEISAVKLLSVAGAYWRGDEHRPMLQRIYGTAFENKEQLQDHLSRLEEAEQRDHRTLGRQLGLYTVHEEIGPGLIVWHPKGGQVRTLIED